MVVDGGSDGLFRQLIESHLCVLRGLCGEPSPFFGKVVGRSLSCTYHWQGGSIQGCTRKCRRPDNVRGEN